MEASLIDCVNSSLQLYMYRNAAFLCERLYAEYPSEVRLLLPPSPPARSFFLFLSR
jgi:anaphase-promoting complex subunit 3